MSKNYFELCVYIWTDTFRDTLNHHCNMLEAHGTDFWWKFSNRDLLPKSLCDLDEQHLEKGQVSRDSEM